MLITFSGIDGSGKSTQLDRLAELLDRRGVRAHCLWYRPGYSRTLYRARGLIRRQLWRPRRTETNAGASEPRPRPTHTRGTAAAWVATAAVDTLAQYGLYVRYLLAKHKVVICDRYVDDALLDFRLHFPDTPLGPLPALLMATSPHADLALLFTVPWETALERLANKSDPHPDDEDVRRARFDRYERLAIGKRHTPIDGSGTVDGVAARVRELVIPMLEARGL